MKEKKIIREKSFASDNNSGIHPLVMGSICRANRGHCIGYGDDEYTENAIEAFKKIFGEECDVYFVLTGTGANVLGLKAVTKPFEAIICTDISHLNMDECAAPESLIGAKLLPVKNKNGKLSAAQLEDFISFKGNEHHVQPKIVSITQATELGTVYTPEEIMEISEIAHINNMLLHMDGARISNAAVHLGIGLKEITKDVGVDILSFGGTKNGLMMGEAVLFFNGALSYDFKFIRKQGLHLVSKMRFVSTQFVPYLNENLWFKNALQANKMAQLLKEKLSEFPFCKITYPVQSNSVFLTLPHEIAKKLREEYFFYYWDEKEPIIRLMTSFDTEEKDIDEFIETLKKLSKG